MSPAPAVTQPHANQPSVSQPVDIHAHAIITAPMTNTKSEPIANLRIQGIVSSNSRSASAALTTRLRRPTSANQLIRSLSFPRESCDRSCWCFSIRNGMGFRRRHYEMDSFVFTVRLSLAECRKLVGTNGNDFWIVAANV